MQLSMSTQHFKKSILVFWLAWFAIALWTDVVGGLAHMGLLNAAWAPDVNYPNLVNVLKMYSVPSWLPTICFIGIVAWLLLITVAFMRACLMLGQEPHAWIDAGRDAFILSLGLWLAFLLADQIVMQYALEANHMVQAGFELLCFLAFILLPND